MNDLSEAEWMACAGTPGRMVRFLRRRHPLKNNPSYRRKLRLFACAVCRHLQQLLSARSAARQLAESEQAVAVAERFADGLLGKAELSRVRELLNSPSKRGRLR